MYKKNSLHAIFTLFSGSISSLNANNKKRLYISILILLIGSFLSGIVQIIFKNILNQLSVNQISLSIVFILLLFAYSALWVMNQISNIITWLCVGPVLISLSNKIMLYLFEHALHIEYSTFINNDTKNISNYFETIFNTISIIFSHLIIHVFPALIEMLVTFILFFYFYGFIYSFLLVILLLLFFYFTYVSIINSKELDHRYYTELDQFHMHLTQSITHIEIIKTYYSYDFEYQKMECTLKKFFNTAQKRNIQLDKAQAYQIITCGVVLFILAIMSYLALIKKKMLLGDFVLINNYFLQFTIPITFLGYIFSDLYKNIILLHKSFQILNFPQEKKGPITKFFDYAFSPRIVFHEIGFVVNDKVIVQDISFTIEPKEKIAIVGTSGSGKSTLLKLLMNLYHPTSGHILLSNIDISQISSEELYQYMAIVSQVSYTFFGTIADNIRYNRKDISDKEIIEVLKKLKLYDIIKKYEKGINTLIEDINLSGGEKQRISLARGLLRNTEIFLFDEVTASLDTKIEHEVKDYLDEFLLDKTVIFVTHRLLFAKAATKIIMMKNGIIHAIGTHEELLKNCSEYHKLYSEQFTD